MRGRGSAAPAISGATSDDLVETMVRVWGSAGVVRCAERARAGAICALCERGTVERLRNINLNCGARARGYGQRNDKRKLQCESASKGAKQGIRAGMLGYGGGQPYSFC